jgi:hypothetical protein
VARVANLLIRPLQKRQGLHIDPELMPFPDPDTWVADQRDAFFNGNTKRLRDCIELGADCRSSILAELAVGRIYGCVRLAVKLAQSMILTGKSNDFRTVRRMVPPPLPAPAGTGSKMPRDFRDVTYFKKVVANDNRRYDRKSSHGIGKAFCLLQAESASGHIAPVSEPEHVDFILPESYQAKLEEEKARRPSGRRALIGLHAVRQRLGF